MTSYQDFANWSNTMGNWSSMNKSAQPMIEMQKIMNSLWEQLTRENLALWSDNMGTTVKYFQSLSKQDRPDKFVQNNLAVLTEQMAKGIEVNQNFLEIWKNAIRECSQYLQEGVDNAFAQQQDAMSSAMSGRPKKSASGG
jgi:hypothetical protein